MERDYTESFLKPTEEERQSSLLIITIFFVGVSIFITFFLFLIMDRIIYIIYIQNTVLSFVAFISMFWPLSPIYID